MRNSDRRFHLKKDNNLIPKTSPPSDEEMGTYVRHLVDDTTSAFVLRKISENWNLTGIAQRIYDNASIVY